MTTLSIVIAILALLMSSLVALGMIELAARVQSEPAIEVDRVTSAELPSTLNGDSVASCGIEVPDRGAHLLMVLSPACGACKRIADSFHDDETPPDVTFLLSAARPEQLEAFAASHFSSDARIYFDPDRNIADLLGIEGSPTAIALVDGKPVQLLHVGGPASFREILVETQSFNANGRNEVLDRLFPASTTTNPDYRNAQGRTNGE
jgi:hypothetical protein